MITATHTGAVCEPQPEPDFFIFGDAPCVEQDLQNAAGMGVVTLGPDGEFISSRHLTQDELRIAWDEHHEKHGIKGSPRG